MTSDDDDAPDDYGPDEEPGTLIYETTRRRYLPAAEWIDEMAGRNARLFRSLEWLPHDPLRYHRSICNALAGCYWEVIREFAEHGSVTITALTVRDKHNRLAREFVDKRVRVHIKYEVDAIRRKEIMDWCKAQFKTKRGGPDWVSDLHSDFYFRDRKHAMMFRLRWADYVFRVSGPAKRY